MCWDACKVPASYRLRTNCYRLPSRQRTRRLRRCRPRDAPAASAPARLFAKTAWRRLRSSTRGIAALDAAPRLETCCAPSARSRVRLRRWPKRSTGAWHVPFTRIRCRGSLKRTKTRASDAWRRIWRSCYTTPPYTPRSRHPIALAVCCPAPMPWCLCLRRRRRFGDAASIIWKPSRAHFASCRVFRCSTPSSSAGMATSVNSVVKNAVNGPRHVRDR